jgi:hypothetical protein
MDDEQVGELWRKWFKHTEDNGDAEDGIALIRKLVDERAYKYPAIPWDQAILAVLGDYGIDPEEFKV